MNGTHREILPATAAQACRHSSMAFADIKSVRDFAAWESITAPA
jgi:hypothetical protein